MPNQTITSELEEQYLKDLHFERIGSNFQKISGDLSKLMQELNTQKCECEPKLVQLSERTA